MFIFINRIKKYFPYIILLFFMLFIGYYFSNLDKNTNVVITKITNNGCVADSWAGTNLPHKFVDNAIKRLTSKDKPKTSITNGLMKVIVLSELTSVKNLLRTKKIDLNESNEFGCTALLFAISLRKIEIVKYLLDEGASINLADSVGRTPLMVAARTRNIELVKLLLNSGSEINARKHGGLNEAGETAIFSAAQIKDNQPIIKLLIENGAKLDIKNELGLTAFDLAKFYNNNNNADTIQNAMN